MKIFQKKEGFTLIEIIIVIGIIALLATIGIGSYQSVLRNSRNTKRKTDLKEMKLAVEAFYAQNGTYPTTGGAWRGGVGCTAYDGTWGAAFIPGIVPNFMDALPIDPRQNVLNTSSATAGCRTTAGQQCYLYNSNGSDYKILAHCTVEGAAVPTTDPFYDPQGRTYVYAVYSAGGRTW